MTQARDAVSRDTRTPERAAFRLRLPASFGPGLLWAATAIGVSHLVQSTRAGASAGFGLAASS